MSKPQLKTQNFKHLPLILILIIAAFLRFYNLMHDAPYFFNPDERNMAGAISQFRLPSDLSLIPICLISQISQIGTKNNCNLNPHFFAYGQFPLYLAYISDQIIKAPISLISQIGQISSDNRSLTTDFPSAIFWLRFWSALFSTFTVLLVYLITNVMLNSFQHLLKIPKQVRDDKNIIGLYAALSAAFTPGLIQSAHFGTTESLLTFFFLMSIYLSLSYLRNLNHLRYSFLTSLVIGLSLGSKLTGIFFFVPPFLALGIKSLGYCLPRRRDTTMPRLWRGEWRAFYWGVIGLLILSGSILFFIISSPYNLIQPDNFKSAVFGYEADVATGKYEAFYTRQFVDTTAIVYQAEKIFPFALGWPVFILGSIGFLLIIFYLLMSFLCAILAKSSKFKVQSSKPKSKLNTLRFKLDFALRTLHFALSGKRTLQQNNDLGLQLFIIFTSFLIYFLPNAFLFAKWTRFMTPILPFFAIFTGYLLYQFYNFFLAIGAKTQNSKLKTQSQNLKLKTFNFKLWLCTLHFALCTLAILPGLAFMSIYTHQDSRVQASHWIYQNIPNNSYILSETANVVDIPLGITSKALKPPRGWPDGLPRGEKTSNTQDPSSRNYQVISFDFYHLDENPILFQQLLTHLEKADYILIPSRRIFANYTKLLRKYPLVSKYYNLLFSGKLGFEKVEEISSFPQLPISQIGPIRLIGNDEQSEETYTVFDHPVIRIYRKIKPLTKEQYKNRFIN